MLLSYSNCRRDVSSANHTDTHVMTEQAAKYAASGHELPEVHIRGDKNVRFEAIGRIILACQRAGIQKVGFITEPHALEANSY